MIEITLHEADIRVRPNPDGSRTIRVEDAPSQIAVMFDIPAAELPGFVGGVVADGVVVAPASALTELSIKEVSGG